MAEIALLVVPYELGRLREGVGNGPGHLLAHGAADALASAGATVTVREVELDERFLASGSGEGDAGFELMRLVADEVRRARRAGAFPVLLAGSCFNGVGVVAGLEEPAPGVVWLDAHSDFNEPASSLEGYLDGMGLAILTGSAWQAMRERVLAAPAVPEQRVVLAGARSFEPPEVERLAGSAIVKLPADELAAPDRLLAAIEAIEPSGVYLHIDLDVLDEAVAGVNVYSAAGGLDADQLDALVGELVRRAPVRAVSLTAYDPACDPDDRVPGIARQLLETVAAALGDTNDQLPGGQATDDSDPPAAAELRRYEVKGILLQLARDRQLIDVRCEMPQCYCPQGRRHFERRSTDSPWIPTADHYPRLKMHGGHLTADNVRLAHKLCNALDYQWRKQINAMLLRKLSLEDIADELNALKVRPIHGVDRWTASAVRKAFVS